MFSGCAVSSADAPAQPASSPAQAPSGLVRVELGIYSGRPDPAWTLKPGEAAQLESLVTALPLRLGIPSQGGLGYHGFTIDVPSGFGGKGAARTLVAYEGEVAEFGPGNRWIGIDQPRSVEHFLLETGRARLGTVELSVAEGAIAVG
jgi:hypothetical protein